jgi:hypothetical protein
MAAVPTERQEQREPSRLDDLVRAIKASFDL